MPGRLVTCLVVVLVAAGCMPVVAPVGQAGPGAGPGAGPELVIDVANASNRDLSVGYEFQHPSMSGEGEGFAPRCARMSIGFGEIAGTYAIRVDGETVFEGEVAPELPSDGFFVVRLRVDPDGVVTADQPGWTRIAPETVEQRLQGCG
jgi:hypothetical protein